MHREQFGARAGGFGVPGHVNLIGEHTDYAEGFVMPAAINFATLAGISPRRRWQDRNRQLVMLCYIVFLRSVGVA